MNNMQEIILISAITRNNVIGSNGRMPWHLSSDLKRFKNLTMGSNIIMGYNTFQSIGKALPGRTNIVVTRNNKHNVSLIPGIITASSIPHAFDIAATNKVDSKKLFVIGGGGIYAQTISLAHSLYITHIDKDIEGDVFFPYIDPSIWQRKGKEIIVYPGKGDDYLTRFIIYNRVFSEKFL
ncbi:dihydrofolate reductase [Candidatus Liberibacter brunswickensis]|uniref:dihydrofolate reductase n=1 Tax=Candidatus Liberibacter brunswickensis TaxID=1968796 RepID=UPI002FE39737